jgi:hypothetical protein
MMLILCLLLLWEAVNDEELEHADVLALIPDLTDDLVLIADPGATIKLFL